MPSRRAHMDRPLPRVWPTLCSVSLQVRFEATTVISGHAPLPCRVTMQHSSTLSDAESHSMVQRSQGRETSRAWYAQGFLIHDGGACAICFVCCCPQGCLSQVLSFLLFHPGEQHADLKCCCHKAHQLLGCPAIPWAVSLASW